MFVKVYAVKCIISPRHLNTFNQYANLINKQLIQSSSMSLLTYWIWILLINKIFLVKCGSHQSLKIPPNYYIY